jgi:glutathione peroxidase
MDMMNRMMLLALGAGVLLSIGAAWAAESGAAAPADALAFKVDDIHGKSVDLAAYRGKVLLMVNVASKCGNTPQYEQLEALYAKYKDQGFAVLGFPANNFGGQEPGTNAQILEFCTATYQVKFPMFSKISVKGADQAPLYRYLTSLDTKPQPKGDITWNFEKFLVGRDGNVIARFGPRTKPDAPEVIKAIDEALAAK